MNLDTKDQQAKETKKKPRERGPEQLVYKESDKQSRMQTTQNCTQVAEPKSLEQM
jgi:hypothetical protein